MIRTMKAVRPLKPKRATAIAAKKASASEAMTVTPTTTRLLVTPLTKKGRAIASWKFCRVNGDGIHLGVRLRMSRPGLKAVAIIQ